MRAGPRRAHVVAGRPGGAVLRRGDPGMAWISGWGCWVALGTAHRGLQSSERALLTLAAPLGLLPLRSVFSGPSRAMCRGACTAPEMAAGRERWCRDPSASGVQILHFLPCSGSDRSGFLGSDFVRQMCLTCEHQASLL